MKSGLKKLAYASAAGGCIMNSFAAGTEPPVRPNILLIITDDENPNTLSCYDGAVQTPHIDSIAANGIRFSNANVVHSVCSPSRYAILTGRYYDNTTSEEFLRQFPHGSPSCMNNAMVLRDGLDNMVSVLRSGGYFAGYIGKYHLVEHRLLTTTRFWESAGLETYPIDADPRTDKEVNRKIKANYEWWKQRIKDEGFDYVDAIYAANLRELFSNPLNVHNIEWTTDAAVRFLKQRAGEEQPFFLTVATTYPHGPKPELMRNGKYPFSLDADVQLTGEGYVTDRDLSGVLGQSRESFKDVLNEPGMNEKAPFAKWWDAGVGAILNALKENGLYENTLVIYISDHGLDNNGKSTLYEDGVRVPMLMQWPAVISKGQKYDHVVGSVDLVPTVFAAAGVPVPENYLMNGVSLLPVLKGSYEPVRDALLLQMGYARGIKTDDWKYIALRYTEEIEQKINQGLRDPAWTGPNEKEPPPQPYHFLHLQLAQRAAESFPNYFMRNQLYDLKTDPTEITNLFGTAGNANGMKQLLSRELEKQLPHRPYGEFKDCRNPDVFKNAAGAVWHPERKK